MSPEILMTKASRQKGSTLVIAVFIMVVMLLLVLSMSQILTKSKYAVAYEVLGTRAFLAAQSGMERSLSLLFPLSSSALNSCPAMPDIYFNSTSGLDSCSVKVTCEPQINGSITHFRLRSVSMCSDGSVTKTDGTVNTTLGSVVTSRTIEMEVWQ
jgi:MSHA biogenesis protein MshP